MTARAKLRSIVVRLVVVALLASTLGLVAGTGPAAAENPPVFVTQWGANGSANGYFDIPTDVAVDTDGNVYVADWGNSRVQKFTSTGAFVTTWGTQGAGDGEFFHPDGLAVDTDGNVFVADWGNHRVQEFTSSGAFVTKWGTEGAGDGAFEHPTDVALDGDGNVYVTDAFNSRVQKFTSTGAFITKWGTNGTGNGQFDAMSGIAVDSVGNVYVSGGHRVQKFTSTGAYLTQWGTDGTGDGQFGGAYGVAVDGDDNVYVVDASYVSPRVQEFTSTGTFLTKWGALGSGAGQFHHPQGVAVSEAGRVYVADTDNNRVQVFATPQPDGRIKKGATGTYKGDDVYNTTGAGQTKTGSAARGSSVTYYVSAQNDAPFAEALRLKGTATNTRFRVTYTAGGVDITSQVTAGTYTTPVLAPGAALVVKVEVKVKSTAPAGSSLSATLITKSNTNPAIRDTVKFVTSRA